MKYFGTDGIRGTFGDACINEAFFERLGAAASRYVVERLGGGTIFIGGDTRFSSDILKSAFERGARGVKISDMGTVSTPLLAFGTRTSRAALGVMITASHNPYTDNGIKFFDSDARKIEDAAQEAIEEFLDNPSESFGGNPPAEIVRDTESRRAYVERMLSLLPSGCLKGVKIAIDCANGGTAGISDEVLRGYGAEVLAQGVSPDGRNINDGVGSEHSSSMAALVRKCGADIGLAHDGDGDRLVVADENGDILQGEEVLALIAAASLDDGSLKGSGLVTTVQSNLGLDEYLKGLGLGTIRSGVGDRLVMRAMIENGCNMGGENSGHYIFSDVSPCGDGLAAALKLLGILVKKGVPLSALRGGVHLNPVRQSAIRVERKTPIDETPTLSGAIAECGRLLGSKGRVLVRYSGTERKIRLLVESPDDSLNALCFSKLENAVRNDLQ